MDWLHEDDVDDTEIDQDFTTELPYVESFDVMNENKFIYVRGDCEGTWIEKLCVTKALSMQHD